MRPRKKDRNLPPCVYLKHGAYWLVKKGKWRRLDKEYGPAMAEYARQVSKGGSQAMRTLLQETLEHAEERVKDSTLAQYKAAASRLADIFDEFEPHQVTPPVVAQMMDKLRATPNMTNRLRSFLKLAFDRAVLQGLCQSNPVTSIPRHAEKKRTRYLSDAEYSAIHKAGNPTLRAIMDLCYATGQRVGDVLAIRLNDVTDDGIYFQPQKTDKLGKKLLVRMTPTLAAAVAAAKALHKTTRPLYLLGQRNGKIRSYRGVRDLWDRACAEAKVEDAHIHDLRAKALTDAKRQGKDPKALAAHSTESMTARYLRGRETVIVEGPSFGQASDTKEKLDADQQ